MCIKLAVKNYLLQISSVWSNIPTNFNIFILSVGIHKFYIKMHYGTFLL